MKTFRGNTSWLAIIGAGFFWGWLDCLVAQRTLFEPFGSMSLIDGAYLLTYAASAVPALIGLAIPLRVDRLTGSPALGPFLGAVGAVGCAVMVVGGLASSLFAIMAGVVLAGLSLGALLILWGRVCVCQGSTHALIHITGAYAVSLLVDLMVMFFQPIPAAVFLALCPLISGALFWALAKYTEDGRELALGSAHTFGELGDDVAPDASVHFDARLIAIVAAFYCALGFANFVSNPSSMGSAGSQLYGIAWEICGFCLFVGVAAFGWRARKVSLVGVAVLVLAAVTPFLPLPLPFVHTVSGSFMSAGCVAFDVLCWSLVALVHHFTQRPYVQTVAIVALCQQVGTLLGYGCGVLFPQAETNPTLYVPLVVVLCAGLAAGTLYVRHSNKKVLATLFADTSVDDLPEEPARTALPSGATLSYVPVSACPEAEEGLSLQTESALTGASGSISTTQTARPLEQPVHATKQEKNVHHARPDQAVRNMDRIPGGNNSQERNPQSENVSTAAHHGTGVLASTTASTQPIERKSQAADAKATALERIADEYHLTRREREVFAHLAKGRSAPYIAELYQVSENTVRSHIKHIYTKLDVHSRQELLTFVRDAE